jgi:hypothetical protein
MKTFIIAAVLAASSAGFALPAQQVWSAIEYLHANTLDQ